MAQLLANVRNKLRTWNRQRIERLRNSRETTNAYDYTLGVLGIMKNETMNIDEWVQHYLSMGAGKIFLIDNGSTDDTVSKAKNWVAKGVVELVQYPERHRQRQHYWTAFKALKISQKCQWLLVADLDEFWFCPSGEPISDQLADFRDFDVIYANWRVFGSNGLIRSSDESAPRPYGPRRRTGTSHQPQISVSHLSHYIRQQPWHSYGERRAIRTHDF